MKKLSVLIALVLLVVAGTGYAVTCAQDNVPGATLLVPYFKVSGNGVTPTSGDIPAGGTDTLCAITNVSSGSILVHVTVWNKYSKPVLDFNVPLTGFDVAFWSMRSVLNGNLNVNPNVQNTAKWFDGTYVFDPCGQVRRNGGYVSYSPFTGGVSAFTGTPFVRFSAIEARDQQSAISIYDTPAFSGTFRNIVWGSLDESGDITDWLFATGQYILDKSNPDCHDGVPVSSYSGDFTGYVTIDVANHCTIRFPDEAQYYSNDSIATFGWGPNVGGVNGAFGGPNILMGDIFFVDQTPATGNISGDPMVPIEFDSRLNWLMGSFYGNTFYSRYYTATDTATSQTTAPTFAFVGDGREPLGGRSWGFRYVQDNLGTGGTSSLRTWAIIWRGDFYNRTATTGGYTVNLCGWWEYNVFSSSTPKYNANSYGFTDSLHQIGLTVYDNDEQTLSQGGGPSGGPSAQQPYILLETQRMVVSPNTNVVPANFYGGWVDLIMPGFVNTEQSWVGVQHTGYGLAMSVGHGATLLSSQFICNLFTPTVAYPAPFPAIFGGVVVDGGKANQTN